jgi:photosystem II stability/assembly factor-like uncharacterized protein
MYSCYFSDDSNGWLVGQSGEILRTANGGESWAAQTSGTLFTLTGVHFVNSQIGFAVGNNGTILKTTNGGNTWLTTNSGTIKKFIWCLFLFQIKLVGLLATYQF